MAEDTEQSTDTKLAALQARLDDLEEMIPSTQKDAWPNGIAPDLTEGGGGLDVSKFAFGYSSSGVDMVFNAGYILHGIRSAIAVSGDTFTITNDPTYIYVDHTLESGTGTLASDTSFPEHPEGGVKWVLLKVTLNGTGDDAYVTVEDGDLYHVGNIELGGAFG